ncbi:N-formylglutamate amidohydrolase [Pontibacter liquoris]|uniref:N-formylglutamate amidohydrolase n=1 Tax=Pontibacter liquoris TaxID=2905677 RepID=UPI001FA6FDC6|nr:N-formylglutamate amidohydrolase [Pontibacter liquoris]
MLKLLLTCEHGGNRIPPEYISLFQGAEEVLASHRGYDIGALSLFKELQPLASASYFSENSRLLVELNRSLHHPHLFSAYTKPLPEQEKTAILNAFYFPYRRQVEQAVQEMVQNGDQVLHLSVHTFTPVLNGVERQTDIGLLYDPARKMEQAICKVFKEHFPLEPEKLQIRFNYPYLGKSDGLTTYLRGRFSEVQYRGIELEVNQCFAQGSAKVWGHVRWQIKQTLNQVLHTSRVPVAG